MYYDINQLNRDLKSIVTFMGERKQYGFYTYGSYEKDGLSIRDIYSRFLGNPILEYNTQAVDKERLRMDSDVAKIILELVIFIDEIVIGKGRYW